jgi:predicted hotdog family 3-hydroxylacyl-ACP dehydratase
LRAGGVQRGMLAALRDIRLHVERIDTIDAELSIHATRRLAQASGSLYDFSVRSDGRLLCEGRIAIAFY